ncbi:antitoxin VapB family protein [Halobaculum sp. MBLA0147]|uniref:antitoxin VapB family protein n=1 Tax=Halobaculum sp. MBLA0147 TaxID=3079934 RepID=UPI003523C5B5
MSAADEHIRVSRRVKEALDRRRKDGESYNDVLERVLDEDRDVLAGFGAFEGTDRGTATREVHERTAEKSGRRIERIAEQRDDE